VLASTSDLLWPLRTVSAKMPKLVSPEDYTHVAAKRPNLIDVAAYTAEFES
jgi:hypothetical protein